MENKISLISKDGFYCELNKKYYKDVLKNRTLKNEETYLSILRKAISSQASFGEEGSTTIP